MTRISLVRYDPEKVESLEPGGVDQVFPLPEGPGVTWLHVRGLQDRETPERIGEELCLHPLVMEDVLSSGQRPKAEVYEDYIFLVLKIVGLEGKGRRLLLEQVSLVLGRNYLVTFQEGNSTVLDPLRKRIEEGGNKIRKSGADYLAYAVMDLVVDEYFNLLEGFDEEIEKLEDRVVERPGQDVVRDLHRLRRRLILLRKSVWPLREELASLVREEHELIAGETVPYLRDLYDHVIRVIETLETMREMVSGLLDVYLSSVSNRMNEIMKVLTIMATIFIPLTFISGVYGMNFKNMPELHWPWAYPAVWFLFFAIAVFMLLFFRRKKWI